MSALFLQGNSRDVLQGLPADYVHCVVTSPPYFGLRKYDGGGEIWDGDADCEHEWGEPVMNPCGRKSDTHPGTIQSQGTHNREDRIGNFCYKCSAWRGQLGAESTPELYIQHLIQIMREVRRVLRSDGVFWLNIGDSWAGSNKGLMGDGTAVGGKKQRTMRGSVDGQLQKANYDGCKHLDMVLIPEQLALAARADGWYVRSILIWAKGVSCSEDFNGNPMPESVNGWRWEMHKIKVAQSQHEMDVQSLASGDGIGRTTAGLNARKERGAVDGWQDCPGCPKCEKHDGYILRKGSWRPTDSYEHILMLTKTNSYFCDREAVSEAVVASTVKRWGNGGENTDNTKFDKAKPDTAVGNLRNGSNPIGNGGRNLRSVLLIPTTGYKGAHFAVYNPKLIEPLIKSATSEKGCCPKCGSPWARVIDKGFTAHDGNTDTEYETGTTANRLALLRQAARRNGGDYTNQSSTISWLPTCECGIQETEPCRVLDPFSGAGTTALVSERLGLDSISIDTSAEYIQLSENRIADDEQKRIDEQIKQLKKEAKLASKSG